MGRKKVHSRLYCLQWAHIGASSSVSACGSMSHRIFLVRCSHQFVWLVKSEAHLLAARGHSMDTHACIARPPGLGPLTAILRVTSIRAPVSHLRLPSLLLDRSCAAIPLFRASNSLFRHIMTVALGRIPLARWDTGMYRGRIIRLSREGMPAERSSLGRIRGRGLAAWVVGRGSRWTRYARHGRIPVCR